MQDFKKVLYTNFPLKGSTLTAIKFQRGFHLIDDILMLQFNNEVNLHYSSFFRLYYKNNKYLFSSDKYLTKNFELFESKSNEDYSNYFDNEFDNFSKNAVNGKVLNFKLINSDIYIKLDNGCKIEMINDWRLDNFEIYRFFTKANNKHYIIEMKNGKPCLEL